MTATQRLVLATLLEYAEKFAETNSEPPGGECRKAIALGKALLQSPTPPTSKSKRGR